jgi:predicted RNase H-like HicB family nuclease
MSDAMEYFAERPNLEEVVKKGDTRESLIAMRDFVAHELEGNRCKMCHMAQMRTGELSALVLRLQKLIEDIAAIPDPNAGEEVDELEQLRNRKSASTPGANAAAPPPATSYTN